MCAAFSFQLTTPGSNGCMDVSLKAVFNIVRSKAAMTNWLHKGVQAEKSEGKLPYITYKCTFVDVGSRQQHVTRGWLCSFNFLLV